MGQILIHRSLFLNMKPRLLIVTCQLSDTLSICSLFHMLCGLLVRRVPCKSQKYYTRVVLFYSYLFCVFQFQGSKSTEGAETRSRSGPVAGENACCGCPAQQWGMGQGFIDYYFLFIYWIVLLYFRKMEKNNWKISFPFKSVLWTVT